MSKPSKSLVGQRLGKLIVLESGLHMPDGTTAHKCQCDCGRTVNIRTNALTSGGSKSCGCECGWGNRGAKRSQKPTLDRHNEPLYALWRSMKQRCLNPIDKDYCRYGGRGIIVCSTWRSSFDTFKKDVEPRPSPLHQIHRKNNDGNYDKDNFVWLTHEEHTKLHVEMRKLSGETRDTSSQILLTSVSQQ